MNFQWNHCDILLTNSRTALKEMFILKCHRLSKEPLDFQVLYKLQKTPQTQTIHLTLLNTIRTPCEYQMEIMWTTCDLFTQTQTIHLIYITCFSTIKVNTIYTRRQMEIMWTTCDLFTQTWIIYQPVLTTSRWIPCEYHMAIMRTPCDQFTTKRCHS